MKTSILKRLAVLCLVVVLTGWSWAAAGEGCCPKKKECNKEQKQCDGEKKQECPKADADKNAGRQCPKAGESK